MENKEYINEIVNYLKDDRPAHANASMRRYIEHLGYTKIEIEEETMYITDLLNEKDIIINELQQKLDKQEKAIQEIVTVRKNTKIMYHIGALFGLIAIILGIFTNNILYIFSGSGISIVAIVGLYEAKKNKW